MLLCGHRFLKVIVIVVGLFTLYHLSLFPFIDDESNDNSSDWLRTIVPMMTMGITTEHTIITVVLLSLDCSLSLIPLAVVLALVTCTPPIVWPCSPWLRVDVPEETESSVEESPRSAVPLTCTEPVATTSIVTKSV